MHFHILTYSHLAILLVFVGIVVVVSCASNAMANANKNEERNNLKEARKTNPPKR